MSTRIIYVDCQEPRPLKCFSRDDLAIAAGDYCVLRVDGLPDYGQVTRVVDMPSADTQSLPQVVRRATLQDQAQASENALFARTAWTRCLEMIAQLGLVMRLLKVRYALDRSVIKLFYTADERVDFRQLVQKLGADLRTRVEMRQIGARSAASMTGGMAACGRTLCCATWLNEFENINMRMAKKQGVPLTPSNLNGMCGRLKCCLRFEHGRVSSCPAEEPTTKCLAECRSKC